MCRQSTDAGVIHPSQSVNRAVGPMRTSRRANQPSPAGPFHLAPMNPAQRIGPLHCLSLAGQARRLSRALRSSPGRVCASTQWPWQAPEQHSTLAVAVALGLAYAAQLVRFRPTCLLRCNSL